MGFTLYELLITVMIVGVVLALGVPNLTEFRQNARMTGTANDLHSSFHRARSEAARAKDNITICGSSNSMTATPTCGGKFTDGWIIFEDRGVPNRTVDAGEPVLGQFSGAEQGVTINTATANDYFTFAPTGLGFGTVGASAPVSTMTICDKRGNITAAGGKSAARVLIVTPLGRATVLREKTQVTAQGGCP